MSDKDSITRDPAMNDTGFQTIFDQIDAPIVFEQSSVGETPSQQPFFPGGAGSGFEEIDVTLCRNGSPVSGKILFKED